MHTPPPPPRNRIAEFMFAWSLTLPLLLKPMPRVQELARRWLGWLPPPCHTRTVLGFTLAELLVTLAILGVIAAFSIPKLMAAQQSQQNIAIVKEAASILTGAVTNAAADGNLNASTRLIDLTPYMNYLRIDSSGTQTIDGIPTISPRTCNPGNPCIYFHNGMVLASYVSNVSFSGTNTNNCIEVYVDPNGHQDTSATADGPYKAVSLLVNYNGAVTTRNNPRNGSCISSAGTALPNTIYDPSWFSW